MAPVTKKAAAQRLLQLLALDLVADQLDALGDDDVRRRLGHLAERLRRVADDAAAAVGGAA
jgi:hypothetical protein